MAASLCTRVICVTVDASLLTPHNPLTPNETWNEMTKTQANCLNTAIKSGNLELACKLALLANVEQGTQVYLPNAYADIQPHVTRHQWAGYLSSLAKKGEYKQISECFGQVY